MALPNPKDLSDAKFIYGLLGVTKSRDIDEFMAVFSQMIKCVDFVWLFTTESPVAKEKMLSADFNLGELKERLSGIWEINDSDPLELKEAKKAHGLFKR